MIEILIYGLIGFIVLVGATFLFDHYKNVKVKLNEKAEQKRAKDLADREAARQAQAAWDQANAQAKAQRLAAKKAVLTAKVPQFSTTMSQATMNGKRLTIQELQDFLNGKIGDINKQSDATIEAALKSVEDEMKRLDQIFKRK